MSTEGVDYSFAHPNPAGLKAAGKHFAMRYLTGQGKALTAAERDALFAHGIGIGLVYESTGGRAKGGYANGRADAQAAWGAAAKLGSKFGSAPIYFAVDYDVIGATEASVRGYFNGVHSVLAKELVGVYGDKEAFDAAAPYASRFWQTTSAFGWSHFVRDRRAHIDQYRNGVKIAGGEVDLCRTLKAGHGIVFPAAPTPAPKPKPTPKPKPKPRPKPKPKASKNLFGHWNPFGGKWWRS